MSGIYLHIPFCDTKCIYCDFYSITEHSKKNELINCLIKEIEAHSPSLSGKHFDTIFFGGGTPSLLSYDDFSRLFESLYSNLSISSKSEITIEANPGTLNRKKLEQFKKLPVNRISFGVQSFSDSELKFLTRIHSAAQAIESVKSAQDTGFENINIDLIFALPNQTAESWQKTLEKAIELNTRHIAAYSLIYEEGTILYDLFKKKKVTKADEDNERMMYDFTMKFLGNNGFEQYEVSNYSKPGYRCRHNLKYWERNEYIGFGPSAASFIDDNRRVNVRNLDEYITRVSSGEKTYDFIESIDYPTSVYEYIFLGLRSSGINLKEFNRRYGFDFENKYKDTVKLLTENKLAYKNKSAFTLTSKGYAVCDEILSSFF